MDNNIFKTQRLELQVLLEAILGSRNVYFQPPESIKMSYPAIVYERSNMDNKYANNKAYSRKLAYMVTVIDYDPDSDLVEKISLLPYTEYDRDFQSSGLNHTVFRIYY